MKTEFFSQEFKTIKDEKPLADPKEFMALMAKNSAEITPDQIEKNLNKVEGWVKNPDRLLECYTDPTLDTFCCASIPARVVNEKGEIVEDPKKRKTYLIGVPFIYVAGNAPEQFMRGEVYHEVGHSLFTDFSIIGEAARRAEADGYDANAASGLLNCLEDPRMERIVGGPMNPGPHLDLFEKNKLLIIPSIGNHLKEADPASQFQFLLKVDSLWRIFANELKDYKKPWKLEELNPDVQAAYEKIKDTLFRITGDNKTPALKISATFKTLFFKEIWPVYKELLDKYPPSKSEQSEADNSDKKDSGGKEGDKPGKEGSGGQPGDFDPEAPILDPEDTDNWPPHLKKFLQYMQQKHDKRLLRKQVEVKQQLQKQTEKGNEYDKAKHEILKHRDGFSDPEVRKEYDKLSIELGPIISQVGLLFKQYFPRNDELEQEWKRRGKNFDVRRLVKSYGSGLEKPLGKRENPREKHFLLQIIVDVSGSMEGERIENAVKACISLAEAAKKNNVSVEVLASDDSNVKEDENYLIKSFDEDFYGPVKERMISMLTALAVKIAMPNRLRPPWNV